MPGTANAGTSLRSNVIGTPAWTALTLANSWVNEGAGPAAQWRYLPLLNQIEVIGNIGNGMIANGTAISSTVLSPLPGTAVALPVADVCTSTPRASPTLTLTTGGLLVLESMGSGTTQIEFHLFFPMDS